MWVLIGLLILSPTDFDAYEMGRYASMQNCFFNRQEALISLEAYSGVPPINTQFICVRTEYE